MVSRVMGQKYVPNKFGKERINIDPHKVLKTAIKEKKLIKDAKSLSGGGVKKNSQYRNYKGQFTKNSSSNSNYSSYHQSRRQN